MGGTEHEGRSLISTNELRTESSEEKLSLLGVFDDFACDKDQRKGEDKLCDAHIITSEKVLYSCTDWQMSAMLQLNLQFV
jgi:hypothetical protein